MTLSQHVSDAVDVRHLADEYLMCRTLLHAWDQIPDDGGHGRQYVESRTVRRVMFRCTRCGVRRAEAWSAITGDLLFRTYEYPDGYKMSREDSGRTYMRMEWVRRLGTAQHKPTPRLPKSTDVVLELVAAAKSTNGKGKTTAKVKRAK